LTDPGTHEARLRELFADETARRAPVVIEGCEAVAEDGVHTPELLELMRAEAHGIKGAAAVIEQQQLAELAGRIEALLADRCSSGLLEPELASRIAAATRTLEQEAGALARPEAHEPDVSGALHSLGD
jgi:HPt (histidine-containing phosphotransfer) domain-containing protein